MIPFQSSDFRFDEGCIKMRYDSDIKLHLFSPAQLNKSQPHLINIHVVLIAM